MERAGKVVLVVWSVVICPRTGFGIDWADWNCFKTENKVRKGLERVVEDVGTV